MIKRMLLVVTLALLAAHMNAYAGIEDYDHVVHGFELEGAHAQLECGNCHVEGVFANTPRECAGCHDGSGKYATTFRSPSHAPTTLNCEACHITTNWSLVPQMSHGSDLDQRPVRSRQHNHRLYRLPQRR